MKILIFVACILTISYAINLEQMKKHNSIHTKCIEELNAQDNYSPNVILCILKKYELLDEQGLIVKEKAFDNLNNLISDKTKLRHAKEFVGMCIDQANKRSGSNNEKTLEAIKCGTGVVHLFDKME